MSRSSDEVVSLLSTKSREVQDLVNSLIEYIHTDEVTDKVTGSNGGDIRHWINEKLFSEIEMPQKWVNLVLTVPKDAIDDPDFVYYSPAAGRVDRGRVRLNLNEQIPSKVIGWIELSKDYVRSS